ncbi:MAG TPA: AAA family ATPase [Symbiobacteriaceae bacterium]|jgi:type II secretory pathway predicted ATPase ExeA
MFREHFGLTGLPFRKDLPTSQLFPSQQHQELVSRLQYIIQTRAFGLITGETGAGKSTAVRALYDQVDRTQHQFVYIADSELNPRSFYRDVLGQLGVQAPFHGREAKRLFETTLLEGYRSHGRQPVIALDEAHLLAPEMLQEIRFILNFQFDSVSPISFGLVGQPELRSKLKLRAYEALLQQVQVRYRLGGLPPDQVGPSIEHQMRLAGAVRPIFSEHAVQALAALTRGIPRLINAYGTGCLLDACAHDQKVVDGWPQSSTPLTRQWPGGKRERSQRQVLPVLGTFCVGAGGVGHSGAKERCRRQD